MARAAIIILLLYKIYSARAVRNSEPLVISAKTGEAVTLSCTFVDNSSAKNRIWYKQRLEHVPLEVGSKLKDKDPIMSSHFKQTRFKIDNIEGGISLRIESVTKEDEGLYFCRVDGQKAMEFSNATLLAVTGQSDISVLQTLVTGSVSPGESVTLQCTVLSEIEAAELRALCTTESSVYNLSKKILDHHHTGTYYCTVAACGKIIVGNGTSVELSKSFCVLLGTHVVCIYLQTLYIST
ncbi:uncharacterized protein LOC118806674 [Colossoma macropomum]|uniref:uncharacterized protein LOC118806674 n=1 Tax=Colossoma macropomum TaxID=42526 RepID=UPI0018640A31|nr:uncharacterized protein LOC118806674 [Colossoma macropomum]